MAWIITLSSGGRGWSCSEVQGIEECQGLSGGSIRNTFILVIHKYVILAPSVLVLEEASFLVSVSILHILKSTAFSCPSHSQALGSLTADPKADFLYRGSVPAWTVKQTTHQPGSLPRILYSNSVLISLFTAVSKVSLVLLLESCHSLVCLSPA